MIGGSPLGIKGNTVQSKLHIPSKWSNSDPLNQHVCHTSTKPTSL